MKNYSTLDFKLDWKEFISKLDSTELIVLNKSNDTFIIAWGKEDKLTLKKGHYQVEKLQPFLSKYDKNFVFSYLSYDIKNNETRNTYTQNDKTSTNDAVFIVPKNVLLKKGNELLYFGDKSKDEITKSILTILQNRSIAIKTDKIKLSPSASKTDYLENITKIKDQIQNGIIYEMNYCVQFKSSYTTLNPVQTYSKLYEKANAPFSSFFMDEKQIIMSASPERYLNKKENTLISQPIKGTAKRGISNIEDQAILQKLTTDQKEISENVMIVDLVRNDLSKLAVKNSVKVTELCKPHSFNTVHQLISTITCKLKPNRKFTDILQATFPMGSMTGAPKISAMQNINHFETFNRGIYSGSIGYIEPNGNFDFNVVIRTIIADTEKKELSCSVGGAITIKSDPIQEYNECLLKLNAIQQVLC